MEGLIEHLPYLGVVVVMLVAGFGVPLPEDVPLLIAGFLCGIGEANIYVMVPLALASVVGADLLIFTMGRLHGPRVRQLPLLRRYLSDHRLDRVRCAYHNHVGKTLFTARFLPGLRTPLFFTAGSVGIPYWKMLLFDGGAALISVPTLVLLAYFGADHRERVLELAHEGQLLLGAGAFALVAAFFGFKWWRRRRRALAAVNCAPTPIDRRRADAA